MTWSYTIQSVPSSPGCIDWWIDLLIDEMGRTHDAWTIKFVCLDRVVTKLRVMKRDGYYPLGSEKMLKVKNHISVPSFSSSHPPLMKCDISKQIDGWKSINAMYVSPEKSWHESDPPPFWVVPRLQQLFCTLWILKVKFTRKILAWVRPPPPFLAMPGFWTLWLLQPLP